MKIKIYDDLEAQKSQANFEGFLEGRNKTIKQILIWKKGGVTTKEIFKLLKILDKQNDENNNQQH